ncbi:hypothetical protein KQI63_12400 [bacterium]|nr:hypothetical protein [bacterium]
MRRQLILLFLLLATSQAVATNPLFEISYTMQGAGRDNYDLVLQAEDDNGLYTFSKPAVWFGYTLALWKDVTPGMAVGVRYLRGMHLPPVRDILFPLPGLLAPKMNYHYTEGWRLGARFYRPQPDQPRATYPFLSAGFSYTRSGWEVKNGLLGVQITEEELDKAYTRSAQWDVDAGGGLFFYRGKRIRIAIELTFGLPLIYTEEPYLNSQMNLIFGF